MGRSTVAYEKRGEGRSAPLLCRNGVSRGWGGAVYIGSSIVVGMSLELYAMLQVTETGEKMKEPWRHGQIGRAHV